jgi:hypothetical protein
MGQQAQNGGRQASLDSKKRRAAGRLKDDSPERAAIKDSVGLAKQKGRAGGAFGKDGVANRKGTGGLGEGGGGGGADAKSRIVNVGASTKPARKRGTAASRSR